MKKIFTLLFIAGIALSAHAQQGRNPRYRDGGINNREQSEQRGYYNNQPRYNDGYPSYDRRMNFNRYKRFEHLRYEKRHFWFRHRHRW